MDWAAFVTKEVYLYLTIFWGTEFIGWKNLASQLFKALFFAVNILPENHQSSTLQIKDFSLCLFLELYFVHSVIWSYLPQASQTSKHSLR